MMEQQPGMDQTHVSDAEQDKNAAPPLNVGAILREARERSGMSVGDVANRLKFSARQIAALEEGDFAQLPETTFLRGFVRSYARLLQLDEAPLLAALPAPPEPQVPAEQKPVESPFPNLYALRKTNILWLAAALVVAVIILVFTWPRGGEQAAPGAEEKVASAPVAASAVTEALPASAPIVTTPPETQRDVDAAVKDALSKVGKAPPAAGGATGAASAPVAHKPAARAALRLVFDEDSWVEIKDGSGAVLLSELCLSGTERTLNGVPPISVAIGNAKGVKLFYKGNEVDLAPHTTVDVAHVKLR